MSDPDAFGFEVDLSGLSLAQRTRVHDTLLAESIAPRWSGTVLRVDAAYEARVTSIIAEVRAAGEPMPQGPVGPSGPGVAAGAPPPEVIAYGQAGPYQGYPPPARTNTLAIASIALGAASFVICPVTAPAGIYCGLRARREIRESGEQGDGLAVAGIVISAIMTALIVLGILVALLVLVVAAGSN